MTYRISPIEPRTAGSLKGFGFTVTWGAEPADPDPSGVAADSGGGSSSPASSATLSEPGHGQSGARPASAGAPGGEGGDVRPAVPANANFARVQVIGKINE